MRAGLTSGQGVSTQPKALKIGKRANHRAVGGANKAPKENQTIAVCIRWGRWSKAKPASEATNRVKGTAMRITCKELKAK
jgi:hypothetical protein